MPRYPKRSIRLTEQRGVYIEHQWRNMSDEDWTALCQDIFKIIENFRKDHIHGTALRGDGEIDQHERAQRLGE